MNLEDKIELKWRETYDGCDPAVEGNPRVYSLGWFRAGFVAGLEDARMIATQVLNLDHERAQDQMFTMGHAQGVAFAAFAASHCSLDVEVLANLTPSQAAHKMRDAIVDLLKKAAEGDKLRAEAKL